jgi:hypothetical protein
VARRMLLKIIVARALERYGSCVPLERIGTAAMKTSDVLMVVGVVLIPVALAVYFGVLAALAYTHPGPFSNPMLRFFGSIMCLVVATFAGLIMSGRRLRKGVPSDFWSCR